MRRLTPRLAACALVLGAGGVQAHPFTVEDLLARQRLGPVVIDPTERWLVASSTAPYNTATRFDLGVYADMTLGRLDVIRLARPQKDGAARIRRLFPQDDGYGYQAGPFSPSGDRMAVTRARGHDIELGVVDLATGEAVWTGLTPVFNLFGRALQWRGETQLVALVRDPGAAAWAPGTGWQAQARITDRWAAAARGAPSVSFIGSGRYLGEHNRSPPGALVLIGAATGRSRRLARGDFMDLEVSPDGAYAATLAMAEDIQPDPKVLAQTGQPHRRQRLEITNLSTGEVWRPCPACEFAMDLLAWAPSGARLLAYGKPETDAWDTARYWTLMPADRVAAPLAMPDLSPAPDVNRDASRVPRGGWMGAEPLVLVRPAGAEASARRDWYRLGADGQAVKLTGALPRDPATLVAIDPAGLVAAQGDELWRVDADGRAARIEGDPRPAPGPGVPSGERLALNVRPTFRQVSLALPAPGGTVTPARLTGSTARPLGPPIGPDERLAAIGPRGGAVATIRRNPRGSETVLLRPGGQTPGPPLPLITVNQALDTVSLATPVAIPHQGPHGEALTSWLYRPPFPTDRPAPLVVVPYPGRVYPDDPAKLTGPLGGQAPDPQVLTGAGFAVLLPSLPLVPEVEPMTGLADRILAVVDQIHDPAVDPARLALWGHSYGGYAVLGAATQSPRFKAIVAAAASPDLFAAYGRSSLYMRAIPDAGYPFANASGWLEAGQARMGATPWDAPDRYIRNSPIFAAPKITAPVLLITGDLDGDPVGPRAMFNALYRLGKDAMLLDYFGEGHVILGPGNVRDQYTRVLGFLRDSLAPAVDRPPVTPAASTPRPQSAAPPPPAFAPRSAPTPPGTPPA